MKTLAIAGASGYTGRRLVPLLDGSGLKLLLRPATAAREPWMGDPRVVAINLTDPAALAPVLEGVDEIICLVGTTRAQFDERTSYETVDYAIPAALAQAGSEAGARKMHLLTAVGAPRGGPGAYLACKKKAEEAVRSSGLTWTLVRPGGIVGPGRWAFRTFDPLLGPLTHLRPLSNAAWKYHSINVERLAGVFATLTRTDAYDNQVIEGERLHQMTLIESAPRRASENASGESPHD